MLDERKEYEEYTTVLNENSVPRLKPNCFAQKKKSSQSNLLGLQRALTIIARRFLFDEFHYEKAVTPEQQTEILNNVKYALKSWCGFLSEEEKRIYDFDGWLATYYQTFIKLKNFWTWEDVKKDKSLQFTFPIFPYKLSSESKNNLKAISYERILAKAIDEGPLCTYYLICKKEFTAKVSYLTNKGATKPISAKGVKPQEYRDLILKFIALYLIEQKRTGNDFTIVNLTDFSHWVQRDIDSKKMKIFSYNSHPLFEFINAVNGNTMKFRVHPDYIATYKFRIVTKEEFSALDKDEICFTDEGSGEKMGYREG